MQVCAIPGRLMNIPYLWLLIKRAYENTYFVYREQLQEPDGGRLFKII